LKISSTEESTEESNQTIEDVKIKPKEEKLDNKEQPSTDQLSAVNNSDLIDFTINNRIEALDFNQEWYPAKILEVDHQENEVLIHFEKFSSKYDEWVSMTSSRLRPMQQTNETIEPVITAPPASIKVAGTTHQFEVGERCLAAWSNSQKFPATVSKVLENNTYEVLFDDGFVKTLKGHRMSKTGSKPLQASPLFEPIKSSKQDRREKKKKLNVASLFKKRQRGTGGSGSGGEASAEGEKPTKKVRHKAEPSTLATIPAAADTAVDDVQNWRPLWHKGRPVGTDAMLETGDGLKHTVIVPDPRLPEGWAKHLLRRNIKGGGVKWDTIITSPENRRFRSKHEVRVFLEANPTEGLNVNMFDFCLVRSKPKKVKQPPVETPEMPPEPAPVVEPQDDSQMIEEQDSQDEDNSNSLKILFEDNAYKCPIEGCGKNFRRENLAQMHVKHYHPEYTKFLDSTPNVADLAYARTVGENLDKSPGPSSRPPVLKPAVKASTPKASKLTQSPHSEMADLRPAGAQSPSISKSKDAEIIKLLNSKPSDKKESDMTQSHSLGIPPGGYPDLKLKDLLSKSEGVPKRDEFSKSFAASRPAGIKTLLPVARQQAGDSAMSQQQQQQQPSPDLPPATGKRKRVTSDNADHTGARSKHPRSTPPPSQTTEQPPSSLSPASVQHPIPVTGDNSVDPLPTAQPATAAPLPEDPPDSSKPDLPPNNIIIEGGEVIKIVRMKQEEIINCTCGYTEEDGLMIQCELCLCWQHAYCNNIERESQVPEKYICYICQNPFRERLSRKYYHDQDWLKQGILPTGSYHSRDEEQLQKRFEKLKKCHDLSGGLQELKDYMHSLAIKLKIAEMKNHPKLYLWAKMWEKNSLPEKVKEECDETKHKIENIENEDHQYIKTNDPEKQEKPDDAMLMMILKAGKEVMPKLDLNLLMDNNMSQLPIIPQPEAAIDSSVCRDNLLHHIRHQESLVEERLDDFEKQIDALEECMDMEVDMNYPKMRHSLQMLARDLEKLKEFSHTTTI
ncbi:unnamed protein product, partial [Callosobruchus maculatus]